MRVLVCGGRNYANREQLYQMLDGLSPRPAVIIHGGARGADRLAGEWAAERGVPVQSYTPNWAEFGLAAGPKRNQLMLDESKPDLAIAFPGGRGTADMVQRIKDAGITLGVVHDG